MRYGNVYEFRETKKLARNSRNLSCIFSRLTRHNFTLAPNSAICETSREKQIREIFDKRQYPLIQFLLICLFFCSYVRLFVRFTLISTPFPIILWLSLNISGIKFMQYKFYQLLRKWPTTYPACCLNQRLETNDQWLNIQDHFYHPPDDRTSDP